MAKYNSRYPTTKCTNNMDLKQATNVNQSGLDAHAPDTNQRVMSAGTENGDTSANDFAKATAEEEEEHSPLSKKRKGSNIEPSNAFSHSDQGNAWHWRVYVSNFHRQNLYFFPGAIPSQGLDPTAPQKVLQYKVLTCLLIGPRSKFECAICCRIFVDSDLAEANRHVNAQHGLNLVQYYKMASGKGSKGNMKMLTTVIIE